MLIYDLWLPIRPLCQFTMVTSLTTNALLVAKSDIEALMAYQFDIPLWYYINQYRQTVYEKLLMVVQCSTFLKGLFRDPVRVLETQNLKKIEGKQRYFNVWVVHIKYQQILNFEPARTYETDKISPFPS